jgi:photosystem II stability/assembly factor-like uncharacterized protein
MGVSVTSDNGETWTQVNAGLTNTYIFALKFSGSSLFAGTFGGGVFRSTDNGGNWIEVNNGMTFPVVFAFAVTGTNIFAGTFGGGVFLSTDDGDSWTPVNNGLANLTVYSMLSDGTNLYAGTFGNGVFKSTDNGSNWFEINNGLTFPFIYSLAEAGTDIFAGTAGGGVYKSTDGGSNWISVNTGLTNPVVQALTGNSTDIYAGTTAGGTFHSSDGGNNWTQYGTDFPTLDVQNLILNNDYLFAATKLGGVWKRPAVIPVELTSFTAIEKNNKVILNWLTATETNNLGFDIERLVSPLPGVNAGPDNDWEKIGFVRGSGTTTDPESYTFTDNNISAGYYSYRLKQINFDGSFTYSNKIQLEISNPGQFSLSQNYPNPFNPVTRIEFTIPENGNVSLQIFNTLGEELQTPVNAYMTAGNYHIDFHGENYPSGIYFYKLTEGNNADIKKMILIK